MYKSYFKIGIRNLLNDKVYSIINVGGLALGVAISILIGLWVYDEFSFNRQNENYDSVAAVLQHITIDGKIETWPTQSFQLGEELRNSYGSNFKRVVMSSFPISSILSDELKAVTADGCFMEADAPELLSLQMLRGTRKGLQEPTSILLSASVADRLFGDQDPIGKILKIDNSVDLKVTAVYRDIEENSSFKNELSFIAPLDVLVKRGGRNLGWVNNWLQVFVEMAENVKMENASIAIKDVKKKNIDKGEAGFKPELFLHPMSKWQLYSSFRNGVNAGGRIEFVWLFGAIGGFVLLLACINFMNLSTARSQKRAKEVGVRKIVGSLRIQLLSQFFIESLLVVTLAFVVAIIIVQLSLPLFNEIADKKISILWVKPSLWLLMIAFALFIAFVAGSYPAIYLSAFKPIKVLKGTFSPGSNAAIRKGLVILQFTVSVTLIIATSIVYQQVQFVKDRPIGYDLNGLVTIEIKTKEVRQNYDAFRNALLVNGIASEVATSETTITNLWWSDSGFDWKGKDPTLQDNIYRGAISYEFGKAVGWKIKEGRDFSRDFLSDSTSMILNQAAVTYMGFENPIGETIKMYDGKPYTVIGVVEDMLTQSVYSPSKQTVFLLDFFDRASFINIRISPQMGISKAMGEISGAFVKLNPATPFEYRFADDEFAEKVSSEQRIGKLVAIFAVLAILISCLGLFGLASFVTEQRTKEIGVRKVLGASVFKLWKMLSKDFVGLVTIAAFIAAPISFYLMSQWLQNYEYRTEMAWWIFVGAGLGALFITMATVSYQSLKAAMANPAKSLRTE